MNGVDDLSLEYACEPEDYAAMKASEPLLKKYIIVSEAKELGVSFGPEHLTIEEVLMFGSIRRKLTEMARKNGEQRTTNL